jgi:putative aminopeptidase FrvX
MPLPELLERLLTTPGPSGYETAPAAVWREAASAFAEVRVDATGNSYARVAGTGDGPLLAVVGHVDEIGIVVTHVEDSGLLAFRPLGGHDPSVLVGQRVELLTRGGRVPGVVARKRLRPEERKDRPAPKLEDLHVDVGAKDAAEAQCLVSVGDPGVVAAPPLELAGGRFASRSLDNRLGAYIALEAARLVAEAGGAPGDVVAVASIQEEIGDFAGARTSAFSLEPGVAVAVDVTPATDVPGGDPREGGNVEVGAGPAICRGSTLNPRVVELLREAAEAESIPYSIEITTGDTSTDADAIHLSRAGVPTGLVSVPIRYVHTPVETAQLSDVENTARVVAAFARRLEPGTSFER